VELSLGGQEELSIGSFVFFLGLLLVVLWLAKRGRFFHLPPPLSIFPVTWLHVGGALLTYLVVVVLAIPLLMALVIFLKTGSLLSLNTLSPLWKGWMQVGGLSLLFGVLLLYCFLIPRTPRRLIFWGEGEASAYRFFKSARMGFLGWVVSYPCVLVCSAITGALAIWIWKEKIVVEQVAVKQLKMTMGQPVLFLSMIGVIIVLVPCIEEFLFRGLLQNFLKRYVSRFSAVLFTAIFFAVVHFAPSQGLGNFQLLLSLLALSGFLGFIYEREQTLWAPITLHMTFNAFNIFAISFLT
jgi:uncharacterized protein